MTGPAMLSDPGAKAMRRCLRREYFRQDEAATSTPHHGDASSAARGFTLRVHRLSSL